MRQNKVAPHPHPQGWGIRERGEKFLPPQPTASPGISLSPYLVPCWPGGLDPWPGLLWDANCSHAGRSATHGHPRARPGACLGPSSRCSRPPLTDREMAGSRQHPASSPKANYTSSATLRLCFYILNQYITNMLIGHHALTKMAILFKYRCDESATA